MRRQILIALAAASLTGCAGALDAPMGTRFGEAVASMQAQAIPAPVSDLPPEDSGARAAAAISRLQKGEVRKPEAPSTSTVGVTTPSYSGK